MDIEVIAEMTGEEFRACRRLGRKLLARHAGDPRLRLAGLAIGRLVADLAEARRREAERRRSRERRRRMKEGRG